jgi:hypothetical protein
METAGRAERGAGQAEASGVAGCKDRRDAVDFAVTAAQPPSIAPSRGAQELAPSAPISPRRPRATFKASRLRTVTAVAKHPQLRPVATPQQFDRHD